MPHDREGRQRLGLCVNGDHADRLAVEDAARQLGQACGHPGQRRISTWSWCLVEGLHPLLGRGVSLHQRLSHRQQRVERLAGLLLQATMRGHIPGDAHTPNDLAGRVPDGGGRVVEQGLAPLACPEDSVDALLVGQDLPLKRAAMG